jgi:hypothetical protein
LFAPFNVLDGTVIGRCMIRHRQQEFIRFLKRIEAMVPAGKLIHAIYVAYDGLCATISCCTTIPYHILSCPLAI